jgi:putative membrane protein
MPRVLTLDHGYAPGLMAPVYAGLFALGGLLFWASATHPAAMPVFGPFEFAPFEYGVIALVLVWFVRGLMVSAPAERLPVWRQVLFIAGLALIYIVLQTRFEYWAQHMFFINRAQHVAMHHLGPFLIALGFAGSTVRRGMPAMVQRLVGSAPVSRLMAVLQQPIVATVLFSGSFAFWLMPGVHFRAMLDPRLYALMNWTMVLDGVLFWAMVLDPRPRPAARAGYGTRLAMAVAVMFPQIALGAVIGLSGRDLYPYYDLCGRLFPDMGALTDQHVGGIIIWIPPAMMSAIAVILVLNALRINEDRTEEKTSDATSLANLASTWTGR